MKCNEDCFNCPYEDCIADEKDLVKKKELTRHKNPRDVKKYNHDYYIMNRDYYLQKSRERAAAIRAKKKMERESKCFWCHKEWNEPREVIRYKGKYFCDEECLGEYLVDKAEGEFESVWHDTEENIKTCEQEKKAEW